MSPADGAGSITVLPPLLAIVLAVATGRVVPSLLGGIVLGYGIRDDGDLAAAVVHALDGLFAVLADGGDARVLAFILLVGALLAIVDHGGGVRGFVHLLERRRWVDSPGRAQWLAWGVGLVVFIESTITLLVAGAVARPLFDRFRVARARLAYLIDSTSAPICMLVPLNAWGAVNLGLLGSTGVAEPLTVFLSAVPLNFYAFAAVGLGALSIRTGLALGPMAAADARARNGDVGPNAAGPEPGCEDPGRPALMLMPILVLVAVVPVALTLAGGGDPTAGSGSEAILWAVLAALAVAWFLAVRDGHGTGVLADVARRGAGEMLPVSLLLLLALALGDVTRALGTGTFLAGFVSATLPALLLPALVFAISAVTAFAIGTSFGTFALMIPLAVPMAELVGLPAPLLLAAVLSGAVFGDQASPISDTTVVASLAAGTDHIEHVRTQLPYALLAAAVAGAGFLVAGLLAA